MSKPRVEPQNDLPLLRKLACQQRREIGLLCGKVELLFRALDHERLLRERTEERLRWIVYARSEN